MTTASSYSTWPIRKSKSCPSVHGTLRHEPQPYVSYNPIHGTDIEKLLSLESELSESWTKVKKTKDAEVWRRNSTNPNTPPITKAVLHLEGVPYKIAVKYITDWEERRKWDKTFSVIDILERIGNFKVIYCSLKMPLLCNQREMVLACLERHDFDQRCHIQAMCSILHPSVPQVVQSKSIRAESFISGIIVRPINDGTQSSKVTVISQVDLRGTAPQGIKNNFLAGNPIKWMQMFKKYYAKHKNEADRKVSEGSDCYDKNADQSQSSQSGSPDKSYKNSNSVDNIAD